MGKMNSSGILADEKTKLGRRVERLTSDQLIEIIHMVRARQPECVSEDDGAFGFDLKELSDTTFLCLKKYIDENEAAPLPTDCVLPDTEMFATPSYSLDPWIELPLIPAGGLEPVEIPNSIAPSRRSSRRVSGSMPNAAFGAGAGAEGGSSTSWMCDVCNFSNDGRGKQCRKCKAPKAFIPPSLHSSISYEGSAPAHIIGASGRGGTSRFAPPSSSSFKVTVHLHRIRATPASELPASVTTPSVSQKKNGRGKGKTPANANANRRQVRFWYPCEQCTKVFQFRADLVSHIRTHTGEKPLVCSFEGCEKRFAHSSNLRAHERSHAGHKPYTCHYSSCKRSFAHSASLKEHIWTHTGHKPYVCDFPDCGKSFTQVSNCNRHKRLHEEGVDMQNMKEEEEEDEDDEDEAYYTSARPMSSTVPSSIKRGGRRKK